MRKNEKTRDMKSNSNIRQKRKQNFDEKCKKTVDICTILFYIVSYKYTMA